MPSLETNTEVVSPARRWSEFVGSRRVPRTVLVCWLVFLAMTALGGLIVERRPFAINQYWLWLFVETMVASFLCALLALATIIGSLAGRSWIASWLGSVLLACIHTAAFIVLSGPNVIASDRWSICAVWPALLLASSAPLILMRVIFGWTLMQTENPGIARWKSSLEDLMMVGVVIACSMTIAQALLYTLGQGDMTRLLVLLIAFAGVSLSCIPITVYVSFRLERWTGRVAAWLALTGVAFFAIFCLNAILEGSWNTAFSNLPHICVGVTIGCLTIGTGIIAIRSSGYRLTYFESSTRQVAAAGRAAPLSVDSSTERPEQLEVRETWLEDRVELPPRRTFSLDAKSQARIATAFILCAAAFAGIRIQLDRQREINFYRHFKEENLRAADIQWRTPRALAFTPGFGDNDLERFSKYSGTIRELSLAGTNVTDAVFPKLEAFYFLEKLDLSKTKITTDGLLKWSPFSNPVEFNRKIHRLSLADTKVDWPALRRTNSLYLFGHLDLSGLNITDKDLAKPIPVEGLTLARNPITDAGIQSLVENQGIDHLDLTDTQITGTTLATPLCPEDLVLDGTNITDATLSAILNTGRVRKLSIARTSITPALLPQLANLRCLRLGKGLIKETDLATLTTTKFEQLWLNDKQFTGVCFQSGLWANSINLSGSSISDDVLVSLTSQLQFLGLANTQITGRSVPFVRASVMDLRNTRVTADQLKNRLFLGMVIVALDQFTPEELAKLSRSNVAVGDQLFSNSEDLW